MPNWFLGVAAAAFLSTSVLIGSAAVVTWAKANDATQKNAEQDRRIDALEQLSTDIAGIKADMAATHALAVSTDGKLDRLIDRELDRGRQR